MRIVFVVGLWGCAHPYDTPGVHTGGGLDDVEDSADTALDSGDTGGDGAPDALAFAAEVDEDELLTTITDLADFGTRYTFTDGDDLAAEYLVDRFAELGLVAELDAFDVSGEPCNNVIAIVPGTVTPDVVYVFSAHYDSTSNQAETLAPGADDNASGVAAVLEAARILSVHPLASSAWFVLTAAEEQGSLGSAHLVERMMDEGIDARGVIAPDMMAYWPLGDADAFDILGDEASQPLVEDMAAVADALGVANKTWIQHDYCYGDDHTNYQDAGFPAISPMDCVEAHNVRNSGEDTPHYHRTTDAVDTLHLGFTAEVARVTTATFAGWVGAAP
ncbi:hypothetical protein LBMAG42_01620 [Deltaproteobacteria bacterium]|nr:hypothetical protein LBMAG42_01620 [Deltaproteobacteria bacterium]